VNEEPEETGLEVTAGELLLAALIAKDYLVAQYHDTKTKVSAHRQLALDWLDWAVCESDRGRELLAAKAEAAAARKGDGNITIGKK
jgi:hypothetical protein